MRQPTSILCSITLSCLLLAVCQRAFGSQEVAQQAREDIFGACATALTNIDQDLKTLGQKFPPLDGLAAAKIVNGQPYNKAEQKPLPVYHHLDYRKNVRIEQIPPDSQGRVSASGERHIVENGGVELEIYIVNRPVKVAGTIFLLPLGEGNNQMRLIMHLEENPPDRAMEKAVRDVVEKYVEALSRSLRAIRVAYPEGLK